MTLRMWSRRKKTILLPKFNPIPHKPNREQSQMAKSAIAQSGKRSMQSILDKKYEDVERPTSMPPGRYLCIVDGQPQHGKSEKKGTEYYRYSLKPIQALDDVDEDELKAALSKKD